MGIIKISDHVYSVGVMNPGLRVFDIVMEAKYGTTYNAYLITGQKNVLVETVHTDFFDEYLYNVQSLVDLQDIDYIIMNHTEPDHSGSLEKLLAVNPNITVVCTAAAQKYLKSLPTGISNVRWCVMGTHWTPAASRCSLWWLLFCTGRIP